MWKKLDKLFCYVNLHRWSKWTHEFGGDDWIITSKSERHCQVCKKKQDTADFSIL